MQQVKQVVDRGLGVLLIGLMGISVVNVLWQVFSRFVLAAPSSFTQELARFLLIWIGVLGAGYSVGQRDHLAFDLLPERLEGRAREWLHILIQGFVITFAVAVMIVGGLRLVYIQLTLGQTSASLGLPIGGVYLVLPLSGLVMVFYALGHIYGHWRALQSGTPPPPSASAPPDQSAAE